MLPNVSSFQVAEFTRKCPAKVQSLCLKSVFISKQVLQFPFLTDKAADGGTVKQDLDKVHVLLGLLCVYGRVLTNQREDVNAGVFEITLLFITTH